MERDHACKLSRISQLFYRLINLFCYWLTFINAASVSESWETNWAIPPALLMLWLLSLKRSEYIYRCMNTDADLYLMFQLKMCGPVIIISIVIRNYILNEAVLSHNLLCKYTCLASNFKGNLFYPFYRDINSKTTTGFIGRKKTTSKSSSIPYCLSCKY